MLVESHNVQILVCFIYVCTRLSSPLHLRLFRSISSDNGIIPCRCLLPPSFIIDILSDQKPEDYQHYDWAVILGGTNDLNDHRDAPDIYTSLQKVWGIPLKHGTKVLALTVPECGFCEPITNERKLVLNDKVLKHQADNLSVLYIGFEILSRLM